MILFALLTIGTLLAFTAEMGWAGAKLWLCVFPFIVLTCAPLIVEHWRREERILNMLDDLSRLAEELPGEDSRFLVEMVWLSNNSAHQLSPEQEKRIEELWMACFKPSSSINQAG